MRKKMTALLMFAALLMNCVSAQAVHIAYETEQGENGTITYMSATDGALSDYLHARLDMDDALILLRSGAEITGTSEIFEFEKDGVSYASLRFSQQGKIRFGRYGQVISTALINLADGSEVSLEAVLGDMDALQEAVDRYVEDEVLPQLNTYLDASELLPVPLDVVFMSGDGLTIHYPADRFSFFSGNSGAVEIKYYELQDVLSFAVEEIGADTARLVMAKATQGNLAGVDGVWLDMTLSGALGIFGELNEPDYIPGGEIYEVEEPMLRGVQLIAPRGAQDDETAQLSGIRTQRVNMHGMKTKVSTRTECVAALGEPVASLMLDASTAEDYRVVEGRVDTYAAGAYTLKMYYDINDVLFAAEVSR